MYLAFSFFEVLPYFIVVSIIAMFIGYLIDRRNNSKRSNEDYESEYIYSGHLNKVMVGISALHKRGANLDKYRSLVLPLLISDSMQDRVGGKMILKKCYSEDFELIKGFEGSKKLEVCKEIVKPLFDKYELEIPC